MMLNFQNVKQVGLGWTVLPGVVDVLETDRVTTKQDSVVVVVEMDGSDQNATEVRNTVQIGIIFKKCLNISKEVTRSRKQKKDRHHNGQHS